jgi:hypothetical protein
MQEEQVRHEARKNMAPVLKVLPAKNLSYRVLDDESLVQIANKALSGE